MTKFTIILAAAATLATVTPAMAWQYGYNTPPDNGGPSTEQPAMAYHDWRPVVGYTQVSPGDPFDAQHAEYDPTTIVRTDHDVSIMIRFPGSRLLGDPNYMTFDCLGHAKTDTMKWVAYKADSIASNVAAHVCPVNR